MILSICSYYLGVPVNTIIHCNMSSEQLVQQLQTELSCKLTKIESMLLPISRYIKQESPVIFLVNYNESDVDILPHVQYFKKTHPWIPIIFIVGHHYPQLGYWCLRNRIWDCIILPQEIDRLKSNILLLADYIDTDTDTETETKSKRFLTQPAIDYIESKLDEKIYVKTLAELCQCQESLFARHFKKENFMSVRKYIKLKRIKKSIELLSDDSLAIQQIAYSVGYEDVSHFNRVFKSICKITPSAFRKNSVISKH